MFKHLVLAVALSAPCAAFATAPAMSIEDSFAVASNAEVDAIISPVQDGGAADLAHESHGGRGSGDIDVRASGDNAAPHATHAVNTAGSNAAAAHAHKGHAGKTPWQSLLPGVMK